MNKLDEETKLFLQQALSGLIIKEDGFISSWFAIQNLLAHAKNKAGFRMFHWVSLHIATVELCPTSSNVQTAIGRFVRYSGDASGADFRAFELYT